MDNLLIRVAIRFDADANIFPRLKVIDEVCV